MKIFFWPDDRTQVKAVPRALAIGIFDGVHRGHQAILKTVIRQSYAKKMIPAAVTFDPHPGKILHPKAFHPSILMSLEHRLKILERFGIREVFVIRFSIKFSQISHQNFLENFLLKCLNARMVSVGSDFKFGCRGLGDTAFLLKRAKSDGFKVTLTKPLRFEKKPISSTRIRRMIERGELSRASLMLGRPVSVFGTVVRGRGRGKKLGFPTANLNPHHEALPPPGVYAARGFLGEKLLKGVIHIGQRPTFKDRQRSLEVHFFNFHTTIYGRELELIFVEKLREIRRFESPLKLAKAIQEDSIKAIKILK